jgi:hypothetical protein
VNVCTLLSNEGKHTLKLSKCPRLLDLLLAHAGIFQHGQYVGRPACVQDFCRTTGLCSQFSPDDFFLIMANAFISFNTQTMHIKSLYTQLHCYVSLKTLYPGGIRTRVFPFLRRMRCPLRHAQLSDDFFCRAIFVGRPACAHDFCRATFKHRKYIFLSPEISGS